MTNRSTIGKIGAYALHAQGKTNTGPATEAAMARFEKQVDPDGTLCPEERAKRAAHAKRLHYMQLGLKSGIARRKKANSKPAELSGSSAPG
mgnify:CR=1 FL=1